MGRSLFSPAARIHLSPAAVSTGKPGKGRSGLKRAGGTSSGPDTRGKGFCVALIALLCATGLALAEHKGGEESAPGLEAALKKLQLPGIKIDPVKGCVDVMSEVCLEEGMLELVACTKGSKEHESIVLVKARPLHIHTALLLLGAQPGNPAAFRPSGEDGSSWAEIPARGGRVGVSLVCSNKEGRLVERPISDFISRSGSSGTEQGAELNRPKRFPSDEFLFAGSRLVPRENGPRAYLCEGSGNVISIATFGDELLCLPEIHSHQNGALAWQVEKKHLPAVGTEVTLRLRPERSKKGEGAGQQQTKQ